MIPKRLRDTTNQEGESSIITFVNHNIALNEDNRRPIENPLLNHTSTERIRSTVINFRIHTEYVAEVHKQESSKDLDGATYNDVKSFATEVLGHANNHHELAIAIKKARTSVRESKDETSKWKKKTIKLMKQIRDVYSSDGHCYLYNNQGEMHFIATFLASILKELFKSHSNQFSLQCGDQAIQADKEDRQRGQKDDERRFPGDT
ncbi:hypothetical protein CLU79DRAFT_841073 [Phycomyces nitens]|nr:hypothetical protein CLU79DRAFT_841309 [Phycomyces nitens]KAI9005461.1 hypothetical protein CLU79DRAFT_841073 [Phycomyces nitens]